MIAFSQPDGLCARLPEPPENVACGLIVVTKGNPSRGKGFEIAHFIKRAGIVRSVSRFDVFLPSMRKAANWVRRFHPRARLVARRKDHFGQLAGLSYVCNIRDLTPISRVKIPPQTGANRRQINGKKQSMRKPVAEGLGQP